MSPLKLIKTDTKAYESQPKPTITYGLICTQIGRSLVALQNSSICYFKFCNGNHQLLLDSLKKLWSGATFVEDDKLVSTFTCNLLSGANPNCSIQVKGTEFEMNVWETLLTITSGSTLSYEGVAIRMGKPTATRAVARAIAKNPVGYFIPCHRVISKTGAVHKYGGGPEKKLEILRSEGAEI